MLDQVGNQNVGFLMMRLISTFSNWRLRPAKTQISPVSSESSLCAHCIAKDISFLNAASEQSDQTGLIDPFIHRETLRHSGILFIPIVKTECELYKFNI